MKLIPLPAFTDNYIWLLHDGQDALVVDPGDPAPVVQALQEHQLHLRAILVTHHHADHTAGIDVLRDATQAQVFGPAKENIPQPFRGLGQNDTLELLGLRWNVMNIPGHTAGHIAYYCASVNDAPLVFCGDTLFSGGCGRIFEGTPEQMRSSLQTLAVLPPMTQVCCTHEYTLGNLKFANAVEPGNQALVDYTALCLSQRALGQPTLPSTIANERRINPFLRTEVPEVVAAAMRHNAAEVDRAGVFATLRQWKNQF